MCRGYEFVYLEYLRIHSELPETMLGFMNQRMRWKRGWTQVAGKLTGTILRARLPWSARLDMIIRLHATWGSLLAVAFYLIQAAGSLQIGLQCLADFRETQRPRSAEQPSDAASPAELAAA